MRLSRATWLVLATTGTLIAAIVASAYLVNQGGEPFPEGGGAKGGGTVHVEGERHSSPNPVPSHPPRPPAQGPAGPANTALRSPQLPTGQQYGGSLQLLRASLRQ